MGFEALFGKTVRPKRKNEAHASDAAPFVERSGPNETLAGYKRLSMI
jgi:hypothetical protein